MTRSGFKTSLEEILGVPSGTLKDSDTRDTIITWSSVADVQILTSVSSEFGVEADAEFMEAESIGDLLEILENQGVFAA
jgi:acyl carrier protein